MFELRPFAVAAALVATIASASAAGIIDATAPPVSGASVSFTPLAAAGQHAFMGTGAFAESWTFTTDETLDHVSFAAISAYSEYATAGFIGGLQGTITGPGLPVSGVAMAGPELSCTTTGCTGFQFLHTTFASLDAGQYFMRIAGDRQSDNTSYGVVLAAADGNITPVSEPETYALMLAGLAGVSLIARRRLPR